MIALELARRQLQPGIHRSEHGGMPGEEVRDAFRALRDPELERQVLDPDRQPMDGAPVTVAKGRRDPFFT